MDEFEQIDSHWGVTVKAVAAFCVAVTLIGAMSYEGPVEIADAGEAAVIASK